MTTYLARNYSKRKHLEDEIRSQCGTDPAANKDHKIQGTEDELRNLALSERTTIFGVKVEKTSNE